MVYLAHSRRSSVLVGVASYFLSSFRMRSSISRQKDAFETIFFALPDQTFPALVQKSNRVVKMLY